MKSITSSHNPLYKELKAIATTTKARREYGQTLLDGVHLSQHYLDTGRTPELCIVSEGSVDNTEVTAVVERCNELEVQRLMVTTSQFKALSPVENGIGIMLLVAIPTRDLPEQLSHSAVLLDGVQDPGNVGAILRTTVAAGVSEVYCSVQTASVWSPKVLRAGMGAQMSLTVHENIALEDIITKSAVPIFATTLKATSTIYNADLARPAAWLFGNEGQGVSSALLRLKVQQVVIPQADGVESLNVAAAAAVCLFEHRRQLQSK